MVNNGTVEKIITLFVAVEAQISELKILFEIPMGGSFTISTNNPFILNPN